MDYDTLIQHWRAGLTRHEIAKEMHMQTKAVCAAFQKAHWMGLITETEMKARADKLRSDAMKRKVNRLGVPTLTEGKIAALYRGQRYDDIRFKVRAAS